MFSMSFVKLIYFSKKKLRGYEIVESFCPNVYGVAQNFFWDVVHNDIQVLFIRSLIP